MNERFEGILINEINFLHGYSNDTLRMKIIKDKVTGVLYLAETNNGGLTVMVDKDGKPLTG
jgi:hypothetical protein